MNRSSRSARRDVGSVRSNRVMAQPSTSSITKYGRPDSVAPPSKTRAMLGWSIIAKRLPFGLEPGHDLPRVHAGLDHLQGDQATDRFGLLSPIDRAEPTLAEQLLKHVRPCACRASQSIRRCHSRGHAETVAPGRIRRASSLRENRRPRRPHPGAIPLADAVRRHARRPNQGTRLALPAGVRAHRRECP